jgi:hypothetical protein
MASDRQPLRESSDGMKGLLAPLVFHRSNFHNLEPTG